MNSIKTFLDEYNNMILKYNDDNILTSNIIFNDLGKDFYSPNIYDKLKKQYPTVKKFLIDNYNIIYVDKKQYVVKKNNVCKLCKNDFSSNVIAMNDDCDNIDDNTDIYIHKSCYNRKKDLEKKEKYKHLLLNNNICRLCNLECKHNNAVMIENNFFHDYCCKEQLFNTIKNELCINCSLPIVETKNPRKVIYCIETKTNITSHLLCAKNNLLSRYKKIEMRLDFNKCCVCGYLIVDNEVMHEKCQDNI